MKEKLEMFEIWVPVENGGEAYNFTQQKNMKLVAIVVGGEVVFLEKNVILEKKILSKEEGEKIVSQFHN